MAPLHFRLIGTDPASAKLVEAAHLLRSAGHLVTTSDKAVVPSGISPTPDLVLTEVGVLPHPESLQAAEARHIAAVLTLVEGNKRQAALLLGVARSTLLAKIRRYGL